MHPQAPHDGETHFIQQCDGPVFIGPGAGTLCCDCGRVLISGYDPARFLAIGIRCGGCGALTPTPGLTEGAPPPFAVIVAEPIAEPRPATTTLPDHVFVIGRTEMNRITALYQPITPTNNVYRISQALLDEAIAKHDRYCNTPLPLGPGDQTFVGLENHALGWSVRHLRGQIRQKPWHCLEGVPTPLAVVHLTGFLHFVATWSHHPLFPAMLDTAAARGFSLHGLAPLAAAYCASMAGNRISFPAPTGSPGRIEGFALATGPTEALPVHVDVFNRFEVPFGQPWNPASLQAAAASQIAAAQARINLRNPGLLVLSPGAALAGFDEALIAAIKYTLQTEGRRNRGLMAVAPVVLRLQATADPHMVRFGYGFFPVPNRHYVGEIALQTNG